MGIFSAPLHRLGGECYDRQFIEPISIASNTLLGTARLLNFENLPETQRTSACPKTRQHGGLGGSHDSKLNETACATN